MRLLVVIVSVHLITRSCGSQERLVLPLTRPRLSLGSVTYTFTDWESLRPDLLSCLPWTSASKHALRMANALKFGLPKPCSLLFHLLSARTLSGRTGTAIDGRVTKFHGFSVPPSALRQSKVSHRLRLSTRENTGLCLALSTFFLASFIALLLIVTVISPFARFPASRNEYHTHGVAFGFNRPTLTDMAPLSSL